MTQKEKKGLSPKYVVTRSSYHSIKSPLSQKKKKASYPNQFITLNTDISHRKLDFHDEINAEIESHLSADYCYSLYEDVKKEATSYIQKYFRGYFKNHPMKVNKSIQPKHQRTNKRVLVLK
ncbi:hypothetical protein M9Y10_022479 [Tritrichomonas musculus]|uniref:IQ calmodulin-binding motif family protein n=1 Tax=Tritrichomonas musculus TaxID=1915356 RepID=A0ABR2KUC4_9EUKA